MNTKKSNKTEKFDIIYLSDASDGENIDKIEVAARIEQESVNQPINELSFMQSPNKIDEIDGDHEQTQNGLNASGMSPLKTNPPSASKGPFLTSNRVVKQFSLSQNE